VLLLLLLLQLLHLLLQLLQAPHPAQQPRRMSAQPRM
jgi:hypothetical protein